MRQPQRAIQDHDRKGRTLWSIFFFVFWNLSPGPFPYLSRLGHVPDPLLERYSASGDYLPTLLGMESHLCNLARAYGRGKPILKPAV